MADAQARIAYELQCQIGQLSCYRDVWLSFVKVFGASVVWLSKSFIFSLVLLVPLVMTGAWQQGLLAPQGMMICETYL